MLSGLCNHGLQLGQGGHPASPDMILPLSPATRDDATGFYLPSMVSPLGVQVDQSSGNMLDPLLGVSIRGTHVAHFFRGIYYHGVRASLFSTAGGAYTPNLASLEISHTGAPYPQLWMQHGQGGRGWYSVKANYSEIGTDSWTYLYFNSGKYVFNHLVTTNVGTGELAVANNKNLRGVNAAGTDTLPLLKLDASNQVSIAPGGAPTVFGGKICLTTATPASAAAPGQVGHVAWDADYLYVCVATDTWKRAALTTW